MSRSSRPERVPAVWRNWNGEERCAPARVARPRDEAELVAAVVDAAARGLTVRAVGAGHSFSDIACTDGVMIDCSALAELHSVDRERGLVEVGAGIRLHALGPLLAEHGLALENQGDIDAQALAGALATATHGTGRRFPNISSRVTGMRLVTAAGEVVRLDAERDPEGLRAARVSLGALGVISTVTLSCVPLYTLTRLDKPRPLTETLERLDELVDSSDHFEFYVFPYSDRALTRSSTRGAQTPEPIAGWRSELQENVIENTLLRTLCGIGRRAPALTPRLNRLITAAFSENQVRDHAYRVYVSRRDVPFNEMEYAIPRAHAREAVRRVLALVERRRLPVLLPVEVRFAAGDDALLSTARGRETCYVAVHQYVGMDDETYFRAVEAIMDDYDGRPHWGKRHFQTAATLRERYPEWDAFAAVRARLDPSGTFANDYTRRVLGPVSASVSARA